MEVVVDAAGVEAAGVAEIRPPLLLLRKKEKRQQQSQLTTVLRLARLQQLVLKNQRQRSSHRTQRDVEAEGVIITEVAGEGDEVEAVGIDPKQLPLLKISLTNNQSLRLNKKEKEETMREKTGRTIRVERRSRVLVKRSMAIWLATGYHHLKMRLLKWCLLCLLKFKMMQALCH